MIHLFIFGLFLGWGAAIPIGAINLEIIRRNLRFGTATGVAFGAGASAADLTYLVILSLGMIEVLHHPMILKMTSIIGAMILCWFGYNALRLKTIVYTNQEKIIITQALWRQLIEGYMLTLINPFTILFWSSISVTIAVTTKPEHYSVFFAGLGVLTGTLSWVFSLNLFLHLTRHRLSKKLIQLINIFGGLTLLCFAALGFYRALFI